MIKTITVKQLDIIAPLWEKLNALHQDLDEKIGQSRRDTTWEQRRRQLHTKALGKSLIQIVRVDDKATGYCFSSIDNDNKGEIDSLYLLPECREKGFGKILMENALKWMNDSECDDIKLWVHPGNTNAIAFYWQFGFATEPIIKKVTNKPL